MNCILHPYTIEIGEREEREKGLDFEIRVCADIVQFFSCVRVV